MRGGFVLNFSDRTFASFFRDFRVEIDAAPYREGHSGSKANRMRSFWDQASDRLVGEVLQELIAYSESYRPDHPGTDGCRAIAIRLQALQSPLAVPQVLSGRVQPSSNLQTRMTRPVDIFFSYAHEDEELMNMVRLQLVVRERMGEIVKWHDRMIPPGDLWKTQIDHRINQAHVILLFMSPHFLASHYCYEIEGQIALRRHREGSAKVIPVVLRACDWTVSPFGELQALPRDGVPITQWPDRDQASLEVAQGIMNSMN